MANSSFFKNTGTTSQLQTAAQNYADDAEKLAINPEDSQYTLSDGTTTGYSALHHSAKAEDSKNAAATSATSSAASATASSNSAAASASSATAAAASQTAAASSASSASSDATQTAADRVQTGLDATATAADRVQTGLDATATAADAVSTAADAVSTAADAASASSDASAASSSASAALASQNAAATSETNAAASASSAAADAASTAADATATAADAVATAADRVQTGLDATAAANSASAASTSATAAAASQVAAASSAASAAAVFNDFEDRYYGPHASDSAAQTYITGQGLTVDQGDLYFNSTANEMRVYDGGSWIAASSAGGASLYNYNFTATASQTTFSGADDNSNTLSYTVGNLIVTRNGVVLEDGTDYTATTGTSVVLAVAASAGDEINIVAFKSFTTADMVSATNGGTFQNNVTVNGTLTATSFSGNGSALTGINTDVLDDTTPQLGGNLDLNSHDITGTGNLNVTGTVTADGLTVDTNTLYVDSTNNRVGVGTASPTNALQVSGSGTIASLSGTGTNVYLRFTNSASSTGYIGYNSQALEFYSNNILAQTIDSSGNVLVGKTTSNYTTDGLEFRNDGQIFSSVDGNYTSYLNRKTSDGDILILAKDAATVGSIGSNAGYLYLGSPVGTGSYVGFGAKYVYPSTSAGQFSDNSTDLGHSSSRFKDLHLGGTAYVGNLQTTSDATVNGTITANKTGNAFVGYDNTGTTYLARIGTSTGVNDFVSNGTVKRMFVGDTGGDVTVGTSNGNLTPTNSFIHLQHGGEISMGAGASPAKDIVLDTSGNLTVSGNISAGGGLGKVLQVVASYDQSTYSYSGSSGYFGPSVTITPSSTSSKLLILVMYSVGNSNNNGGVKILQNGSDFLPNLPNAYTAGAASSNGAFTTSDDSWGASTAYTLIPVHVQYLHSPNTTSSLTYRGYFYAGSGNASLYLNRQEVDNGGRGFSHMTIMEIAG